MNIFHSPRICLGIGLLAVSSAAFCQTGSAGLERAARGPISKRLLTVPATLGQVPTFPNGQLLKQPRNALTMSGWTYDEQSTLCQQIDAGDQTAWNTLQHEVERKAPWAQRVMGMYYLKQRSPLAAPDPARSLALYRQAAKEGDLSAQYELGWRLLSGTGFAADAGEARMWLEKASAQGNIDAKMLIGEMLRDGRGGEQSFEAAMFEFSGAAHHDNGYAMIDLAAAYANGEGVERNLVEAYKWLLIAERGAGGGAFAQDLHSHLTTVANKLKPQEIKKASSQAAIWLSEHPVRVHTMLPARFDPQFDPDTPCNRPDYPEGAKARGEKGKVVIQLQVDAQGKVAGVALVTSSGFAALDQVTMTAIKPCRFIPALRFGKAVAGQKEVAVTW